MSDTTKESSVDAKEAGKEVVTSSIEKSELLIDTSVYIEGVRVLQRQERISYFFTLAISLVLILLLFVILRTV